MGAAKLDQALGEPSTGGRELHKRDTRVVGIWRSRDELGSFELAELAACRGQVDVAVPRQHRQGERTFVTEERGQQHRSLL
jgi:hypothetical protein